jgi:hypothetical protein
LLPAKPRRCPFTPPLASGPQLSGRLHEPAKRHRAEARAPYLSSRCGLPEERWRALFDGPFKRWLERTKLRSQADGRLVRSSRSGEAKPVHAACNYFFFCGSNIFSPFLKTP